MREKSGISDKPLMLNSFDAPGRQRRAALTPSAAPIPFKVLRALGLPRAPSARAPAQTRKMALERIAPLSDTLALGWLAGVAPREGVRS